MDILPSPRTLFRAAVLGGSVYAVYRLAKVLKNPRVALPASIVAAQDEFAICGERPGSNVTAWAPGGQFSVGGVGTCITEGDFVGSHFVTDEEEEARLNDLMYCGDPPRGAIVVGPQGNPVPASLGVFGVAGAVGATVSRDHATWPDGTRVECGRSGASNGEWVLPEEAPEGVSDRQWCGPPPRTSGVLGVGSRPVRGVQCQRNGPMTRTWFVPDD